MEQPAITGIVPAAGASRRMGRDKRRILLGGRPVLEHTVCSLLEGGIKQVRVVLEPDSPCNELSILQRSEVEVLVNPEPSRGMLSSIRVALAELPAAAQAVAVLPGDHPFVPAAAVRELLAYFVKHRPLLLSPRFDGQNGHPLLIHHSLVPEALACDDSVGLKQLLQRRGADHCWLDLSYAGAQRDLDRPEDLPD